MMRIIRQLGSFAALVCCTGTVNAASPSPLFARGYTVIPQPQNVDLTGDDFAFGSDWSLVLKRGVDSSSAAAEILRSDLASRYGIRLLAASKSASSSKTIQLEITPGTVRI